MILSAYTYAVMTSPTPAEMPSKAYEVLKSLDAQPGDSKVGLPRGAAFLHDKPELCTSEGEDLLRVLDVRGCVVVKVFGVAREEGDGDGRSPWYSPSKQDDSKQRAGDGVWHPKRGASWPTWEAIIDRAKTVSGGLSTPDPQLDESQNRVAQAYLAATGPIIRITEAGRTALALQRLNHRLSELDDPIPVAEIVGVVGHKAGRSDKLAEKMKRLNYPLVKPGRKWYCQRKDAFALFPHHRERIKEILMCPRRPRKKKEF